MLIFLYLSSKAVLLSENNLNEKITSLFIVKHMPRLLR